MHSLRSAMVHGLRVAWRWEKLPWAGIVATADVTSCPAMDSATCLIRAMRRADIVSSGEKMSLSLQRCTWIKGKRFLSSTEKGRSFRQDCTASWLIAAGPTRRSLSSVKATHDGAARKRRSSMTDRPWRDNTKERRGC